MLESAQKPAEPLLSDDAATPLAAPSEPSSEAVAEAVAARVAELDIEALLVGYVFCELYPPGN